MKVDDPWLQAKLKPRASNQEDRHLTHVLCMDGWAIGLAVGYKAHCKPKDPQGPWTHVECAYVHDVLGVVARVGWWPAKVENLGPTHYGNVPVTAVIAWINKHGGVAPLLKATLPKVEAPAPVAPPTPPPRPEPKPKPYGLTDERLAEIAAEVKKTHEERQRAASAQIRQPLPPKPSPLMRPSNPEPQMPKRRLPNPDPCGLVEDDSEARFAQLELYDEPKEPKTK